MTHNSRTLMIQGTTSDAGKSTLVAGLGRVLRRRSFNVAPFKPQNMALNSAVTADGGEIGRSQAVQAMACGVETSVHMNPVLIKPTSDTGAQVIIQGKAIGNYDAVAFHGYKKVAMDAVVDSHRRLSKIYEAVLVEGAGSPAEINLREGDIANMGFAEAVDCPVLLVTDIDKGGSFAHLVGTLALLSESEQQRVCGFFINRFRGDIALLQSGLDWLEERTGLPVLGVIPYLHAFHLEAEDAISVQQELSTTLLRVCVLVLPHISNHTDFDPLRLHPFVDLQFVAPGAPIAACDLIIIPGSKAVRPDLDYLLEQGWGHAITRHLRYGGKVLGICGGYQMLGTTIDDPSGLESEPGCSDGLGLLDCQTELKSSKLLSNVRGRLLPDGELVEGYEIHSGLTSWVTSGLTNTPTTLTAFAELCDDRGVRTLDGACSADGQVRGTYLHGVFNAPTALQALLGWAGLDSDIIVPSYDEIRERELDRLADTLEEHADIEQILGILHDARFVCSAVD